MAAYPCKRRVPESRRRVTIELNQPTAVRTGTLHDGAVQQLAGASFAVSDEAERAQLVDLYPPSLRSAGLAPALRDLGLELLADAAHRVGGWLEVSSASSHGAVVRLDVPR